MSLLDWGQKIQCDGESCEATARAVVALKTELSVANDYNFTSYDWLYVIRGDQVYHFCPHCTAAQLVSLIESADGI